MGCETMKFTRIRMKIFLGMILATALPRSYGNFQCELKTNIETHGLVS